jgi:hypothetical protein
MQPWETEARLGVQKAMTDYGRYVDSGQLARLSALFTEPCHYDLGASAPLTDRAAILEHGERLRDKFRNDPAFQGRVRHHLSMPSVEFTNESEAKATSYFLTLGRTGPDHWGVYRDVLVRTDDGWQFARRVVVVEGFAPDSPAVRSQG